MHSRIVRSFSTSWLDRIKVMRAPAILKLCVGEPTQVQVSRIYPMFGVTSGSGQTAPSSFVTAAAGLAPIADVPGGDSDPPITPPVRPVSIRLRKRRRAARRGALRQPRQSAI